MKMLLQVFLTLTMVSLAMGGCCAPKQWEGKQALAKGYSDGSTSGQFADTFKIAYDATNKKIAKAGKHFQKTEVSDFKIILDFQKKKMYRINFQTKKCSVARLDQEFRELCVPDSAKRLDTSYFGTGDRSLEVEAYEVKTDNEEANIVSVPVVTTDGCIPVTEDITGKYRGFGVFANLNTYGVTPGISDPTVFDPPSYCQEDTFSSDDFAEKYSISHTQGNIFEMHKSPLPDKLMDNKLFY